MSARGRIAVIGGGAWGTALAVHAARLEHPVSLWARDPELVTWMRDHRENPVYLPGVPFPEGIEVHDDARRALDGCDLVLWVVPTAFSRAVIRELAPAVPPNAISALANKGIEEETLALPTEIASAELGAGFPVAVLTGPSFAAELARELPTIVTVASDDEALSKTIQSSLSGRALRVYRNRDPRGAQLAGALKNVMAIATGVVEGLGFGGNARAAVVTRGLAEMTRLGLALGAERETFSGLAGLGDLVLTCSGELSRNLAVGRAIGRGERLRDILRRSRAVAEGVSTTRSAADLAAKVGVEMPIVEEVHRILFRDASPAEAAERLMSRPLISEHERERPRRR